MVGEFLLISYRNILSVLSGIIPLVNFFHLSQPLPIFLFGQYGNIQQVCKAVLLTEIGSLFNKTSFNKRRFHSEMPDAVIECIMLFSISDYLLQRQRCLETYMSHMAYEIILHVKNKCSCFS